MYPLLFEVAVGLILSALFLWYIYRKRTLSYFQRLGIPGPPPNFIDGNLNEVLEKGTLECFREWVKKYGRLVGYYFGSTPMILIADPGFVKSIVVKEFQDFPNRPFPFVSGPVPVPDITKSIQLLQNERWKKVRSVISPISSTSKMKRMVRAIEDASDIFLGILKEKAAKDEPFDIYKAFKAYTLDIGARTLFGIVSSAQTNPQEQLFLDAQASVNYTFKDPLLRFMACFPELNPIMYYVWVLTDKLKYYLNFPSSLGFWIKSGDVVDFRKNDEQNKRVDLLSLMIKDNETLKELYAKENDENNDGEKKFLTDEELKGNAAAMLFAAYEPLNLALAFIARFLVNMPDIQDKARQEAQAVVGKQDEWSYEAAMKMLYFDQVMNETMRVFPVVINFIHREAKTDFQYGDIKIPKGTIVNVAVEQLHRDPEFWDEPEKFDPERFSPENKPSVDPYIFQPFGVGPRHCIGMRFAQMAARLLWGRILTSYKLVPCEKTPKAYDPVDYKFFQIYPRDPVYVKAVPL